MTLQMQNDAAVLHAIEAAAAAACKELDKQFPGADNGGITSNFQGHLADALKQMLKGRSVLDGLHGHSTLLPRLVLDDSFFGSPLVRGDLFLILKPAKQENGQPNRELVLQPGASNFIPMLSAGDAFTSFGAAAATAAKYLVDEGFSLEQAKELNLQVLPVEPTQNGSDTGFVLADHARAA